MVEARFLLKIIRLNENISESHTPPSLFFALPCSHASPTSLVNVLGIGSTYRPVRPAVDGRMEQLVPPRGVRVV